MRQQTPVIRSDQVVALVPLAAVIAIGADVGGVLLRFLVFRQGGGAEAGSTINVVNAATIAVSYLALCAVVVGLWRFAKPPSGRSTTVAVIGVAGAVLIAAAAIVAVTTSIDTTLWLRLGQVVVGLWMIDINTELKKRQLLGSTGTTNGIVIGVGLVAAAIALWFGIAIVVRWTGLLTGIGYIAWLGWIAVQFSRMRQAQSANS